MTVSTRAALTVATSGRKRPVASAKPATRPGRVGGGLRPRPRTRCRRCRSTRPPRRGPGQAQGGAHVVPGARGQRRAAGASAPRSRPGSATRGSRTGRRSAAAARSGSQRPVGGGEVAGARGVAAVGGRLRRQSRTRTGRARPERPRAARSASRAGAAPGRCGRRCPARCSASQRSLVTVNEAVGTLPVRRAHSAGPPSSVISSAACGAERRSFHSRAGLITSPGLVEDDHPVLLRRDPDRVRAVEQAVARRGQRAPP